MHYLSYLLVPGVTILWMIGGQLSKGARRYGSPGLTVLTLLVRKLRDKDATTREKWAVATLLLYIPLLSVGYGVNSALARVVKKEWIIRVAYGIMLGIPLLVYALIASTPLYRNAICTIALVGAFQIRAGSLGSFKVGDKKVDLLIEDIVRSLALGLSILWITS